MALRSYTSHLRVELYSQMIIYSDFAPAVLSPPCSLPSSPSAVTSETGTWLCLGLSFPTDVHFPTFLETRSPAALLPKATSEFKAWLCPYSPSSVVLSRHWILCGLTTSPEILPLEHCSQAGQQNILTPEILKCTPNSWPTDILSRD